MDMIRIQNQRTLREVKGSVKSATFSEIFPLEISNPIFFPSELPEKRENEVHFESETSDSVEIREKRLSTSEILEKVIELTGRKPVLIKPPSEIFKEDRLLEDN